MLYAIAAAIFGVAVILWLLRFLHGAWCIKAYPLWLAQEQRAQSEYTLCMEAYEKKKAKIDKLEDRLKNQLKSKSLSQKEYDEKVRQLEADLERQWNEEVKPVEKRALSLALDREWIWNHRLR